jgi:Planctomycete cytochrome C
MRFVLGLSLAFLAAVGPATAQDPTLAMQARKIFKKHCHACHHGEGSEYRSFDVLRQPTLVTDGDDGKAVVVPKKLDESLLWKKIGVAKTMPPRNIKERPSATELDVVQRWIKEGAGPYPTPAARTFIPMEKMLTAIQKYLDDNQDKRSLRFFTLTHLYNNPRIEEEELRIERAALAKAINSLTWMPRLVPLQAIDKEQTIYVVDLKHLGWDQHGLWSAILREYPYGLDCSISREAGVKRISEKMRKLTDDELVHIRADWFTATATRPPLYYHLLRLPDTVAKLERDRLLVDSEANFRDDKLWRAGFAASGVSGQNRLVERHDSPAGKYYWKSYDFKPRQARANLNRFPLGPVFHGNSYDQQAFVHAGGEMIFGLPNGLQGYFLTDGKGNRINEGPTDVVSDALKTAGSPAIVNGVSCMHCHKHGAIPFTDTVRAGHALFGGPADKVEKLYPEAKVMIDLLAEDEDRFVKSLEKLVKPCLQVEEDAGRPIREFSEPVGESARRYLLQEITLETAAYELGLDKPERLAGMIQGNRALKELGLLPLANGKTIKRDDWEAKDGTSLFQDVALALELGSPSNTVSKP